MFSGRAEQFEGNTTLTIATGLVAGIPIAFFFFFDQNVSSLLCQHPRMRLKDAPYFHAPFAIMGLFNIIGPILGLPFVTGSLPHSPQLVRALWLQDDEEDNDDDFGDNGVKYGSDSTDNTIEAPEDQRKIAVEQLEARDDEDLTTREQTLHKSLLGQEAVLAQLKSGVGKQQRAIAGAGAGARMDEADEVAEARLAPLLVYTAIFLSLALVAPAIRCVPLAAVDGILVFVGLDGILETQLCERLFTFVVSDSRILLRPGLYPDRPWAYAKLQDAQRFTLVQLLILAAAWALNLSPYGLAFPLIIIALVPIRQTVLPYLFSASALELLDAKHDDTASQSAMRNSRGISRDRSHSNASNASSRLSFSLP